MLNTIYEEFDIRSKIKELKNKKIKIKRIVKNKEMAQSIILDQNSFSNNLANYESERQIQKSKNPLFYSTTFESIPRKTNDSHNDFFNESSLRESRIIEDSASGKNPMSIKKNKGQGIGGDRANTKAANPMFYSSVNPMRQSMTASEIGQELKDFMLPKTILRVLEDEEPNMNKIISHIEREKRKIDVDIDQTVTQILARINETKRRLHKNFDDYIEMFRKNYEVMKKKCKEFKEKALFQKKTMDRHYMCNLKKITYYGKSANSIDPAKKVKEEPSKLQSTIENLEKEVAKKELTLFAEELNKQSLHVPLYNHSETSQLLLTELRQQLVSSVDDALANFNHLIFVTDYPDFSTYSCSPDYTSVVSVDKTAAIGEFKQLRVFSAENVEKIHTHINSQFTCSASLSSNNLAICSEDGTIAIWDTESGFRVDKFLLDSKPRLLTSFRGYNYDFEKNSNSIANALLNHLDEERQDYLVCITNKGINILKFEGSKISFIKTILNPNIHLYEGIVSLYDGISLACIRNDGKLEILNLANDKTTLIHQISSFPLKSIAISKDYKQLAIGGDERKISILSLVHSYSITHQKQIVEKVTPNLILESTSSITCLNFGALERSLLFAGGSDSKIRIWNLNNGTLEKEVVGHKNPIKNINILENPFDLTHKRNYLLLSSAFNENQFRVSTPYSALCNALLADYNLNSEGIRSMDMGLMKSVKTEEIYCLASNMEEEGQVIYKIKLN